MAKRNNKQNSVEAKNIDIADSVDQGQLESEQAVSSAQDFAMEAEINPNRQENEEPLMEQQVEPAEKNKKSSGSAIALFALLIALGMGGAGYFVGQQKFAEIEKQMQTLQQGSSSSMVAEMPSFEAEKAQLTKLTADYTQSLELIAHLERQQAGYSQQIQQLQQQLQKLGAMPKAEPTAFLLSDADFLLSNALRKMVIDNDLDTAKSLLIEADNVLNQLSDPQFLTVRDAIKSDLNNLASLNQVDQNNLMQRLAQLANLVDDMPMLDNEQLAMKENNDVSDSITDWQKNIEKSAGSFLNHFIRVSDKKQVQDKAFIAPNQEIYLRENIRLRLQIALLAVPRQQNELYKQSLEAISSWVRSYFDVQAESVKYFLKEIDELGEQSIYIDAPNKLQSLDLLKQKLNRHLQPMPKIELEVDKDVEKLNVSPVEKAPESTPANNQQ